jgi:hypothetical protein
MQEASGSTSSVVDTSRWNAPTEIEWPVDWEGRFHREKPTPVSACYKMIVSNKVLHFVPYSRFLLPKSGLPSYFYICEHCPSPGTIEMIKTPKEYRKHCWSEARKSIWPQKSHHSDDILFLVAGLHLSGRTSVMRQIHRVLTSFPPFFNETETEVYTRSIPSFKRYADVEDPMKPEVAALNNILQVRQRPMPRFSVSVRKISLGKITIISSKTCWLVIFGEYMLNTHLDVAQREGVDSFTFSPHVVRERISVVVASLCAERNASTPGARIFFFMEGNAVQSQDFFLGWQKGLETVEPIVLYLAASDEAISQRENALLLKYPFKSYSLGSRNSEMKEMLFQLEAWCDECNLCFLWQKAERIEDLWEVIRGVMTFLLTDEELSFYNTWTKPNAM